MKPATFLAAALLAATSDALPEKISKSMFWARDAGHRLAGRATPTQIPKQPPMLNTQTSVGCFNSQGDLKTNGTIKFNSQGSCVKDRCMVLGYEVGATNAGNQCWCGHKYPPKQSLVADKECNVGCTGIDTEACGGIEAWSVYNTGLALAVDYSAPDSSSSTSATSKPTASATQPATTIIVTPSAEPEKKKESKNVGGIVAGVVVGVLVVASALGAGLMFLRRKRNKEIEEEHRRNAAVSAFIGKPPSSSGGMSMTDSRMDPVMAHRRMSDGSIADNQDYSRRILRVTNA
ncbi:hypothetical protein QBC42DRAFT_286788 [Cladorrhinum samala]|uniref:WSC domain-containing protein n=1 Tax=Cladorrhinum samala TaxID=585594 RepID=A0AAV9HPV8_9PEZI|nr:hypothetical protein QBC42DRAFT_286788 [Cladorrhinum samala]